MSRENLSNWERLWDDFIQEETREEDLRSNKLKGDGDEENLAHRSKVTTKLNTREEGSSNGGKKDMDKVKCFTCHKIDHM